MWFISKQYTKVIVEAHLGAQQWPWSTLKHFYEGFVSSTFWICIQQRDNRHLPLWLKIRLFNYSTTENLAIVQWICHTNLDLIPLLSLSISHFYFSFFIWGRSYLYFLLYPQNTWNHLEGSVGVESSLLFLRIRIFLKQKITLLGSIKHLNSLLIYFFLYFPLLSSQQVRHLTIFFPSKATPSAIINSGAGKLPLSSCTV